MNRPVRLLAALSICATISHGFVLNEKTFQKESQQWIETYIWNKQKGLMIPKEDLQMIANLCYFSFQRSHATLKAQQKALRLLSTIWNGWQNIAHTRLDPSQNTPHTIKQAEKNLSCPEFWTLHDEHRTLGKTYSHTVEIIVDAEAVTTVKALNAIKTMRSESRAVVAQALVDIKKLLGKLFHEPAKKSTSCKKGLELLNYLWDYIPKLALLSFSEADKLNNKVSQDGWTVLHTIQDVSSRTWQALEEARASFYLARYNALYKVFVETKTPRLILFDQSGLILRPSESNLLPMPLLGL